MGSSDRDILYLNDIEVDEDDVIPGAQLVLAKVRPAWDQRHIKHKVFSDGISNKLFGWYLTTDTKWNDMILIRVYGANTELLVDRDVEIKMMAMLNAAGLSPPVYARFSNGLCYGFVQGCCPDADSIRSEPIWQLVAQKMARLHSIIPENYTINGVSIQLDKEPSVFKKSRKWLQSVPTSFQDPDKNEKLHRLVPSVDELEKELTLLQNHLENLGSPVVFCHNDLLINNVVYDKEKDEVHFIDFEYGGFCYEAHDIGNHFAEYAGVDDVDYTRYPGKDFQMKWLKKYLEAKKQLQGEPVSSVTDFDVENLYVQVNKFALASHFYWGIWALIQSSISTIDFDFLGYAALRFDEYYARKEAFLGLKFPDQGTGLDMLYMLDLVVNFNSVIPGALKILSKVRPSWQSGDITYKSFSESIANKLLGCYLNTDTEWEDMVLVKVYGEDTASLMDREAEVKMMLFLNAAGLSPPIYARFSNGLCYGFIPGSCPDVNSIKAEPVWRLTAEMMADIHCLKPEKYKINGKSIELDQDSYFVKMGNQLANDIPEDFLDAERNKKLQSLGSKEELQLEFRNLLGHLEKLGSPVVFCHNDLLLENVVYNENKKTVHFIDFEFGGFCNEAFDIANHFAEFAGLYNVEIDYSRCPDQEFQIKWLKAYLLRKCKICDVSECLVTEHSLQNLFIQVRKYSLASHFFWGLWALVLASKSSGDFDYLKYSITRFSEYFSNRDEILALENVSVENIFDGF